LNWHQKSTDEYKVSSWIGQAETAEDTTAGRCQNVVVPAELLEYEIKGGAIWYDVFTVQGINIYYTND